MGQNGGKMWADEGMNRLTKGRKEGEVDGGRDGRRNGRTYGRTDGSCIIFGRSEQFFYSTYNSRPQNK